MNALSTIWLTLLFTILSPFTLSARGGLIVCICEPKITGQKAVIKLDMTNTFTNKIQAAKGTIFLRDVDGKVISQTSRWFIGGAKDRPALPAQGKDCYYFVVPAAASGSKVELMINRIVLEGGKTANPLQDAIVKEAKDK